MPPTEWLFSKAVTFVHADGRTVEGRIGVGIPEQLGPMNPDDDYESLCWVVADSVLELGGPLHDASTFRVLVSALAVLARSLQEFLSRGGRMVEADTGADYAMSLDFGRFVTSND